MPTRAQLKANAKQQLSGNWMRGVLATLIVLAITTVISMLFRTLQLDLFGSLLLLLFTALFYYGNARLFLTLCRTRKVNYGDLFSGAKIYGRVLGAYLLVSIYTALWSLLFVIPGIVAAYRYRMVP